MREGDSSATRRYTCLALPPGEHPDFIDLIDRRVEDAHGGRYAGYSSRDYWKALRNRGGIAFRRRNGEPAAFFPHAERGKEGTRLQFPVIDPEDENRGLQCFGQWLQLTSALTSSSPASPATKIFIPFPDDNLPSPKLVYLLGLCDTMPERPSLHDRPMGRDAVHRFDIPDEMLPRIVGAMLERHDPWAGTSSLIYMNTSGIAGRARTHLPPDSSPMSPIWMPTLVSIVAGKLSVIGLKDLPAPRRYGPNGPAIGKR